ncbi:MAG: DNA polymerase IV [Acidobacteriota bacterium]
MPRTIMHADLDAFYAAVEQHDRPQLRGRPVLVGGRPEQRGVVAAASYEARRFGCRSAMPMRSAVRLCPRAVVVPPRFDRYREVSRQVQAIFRRYTDRVEPLSLDESYLDVTGHELPASEVARRIKRDIRAETGLTASAGAGPNKLVAKIASDLRKPDGLVVVPPTRVRRFLAPLPVSRLWGIGRVGEQRLARLGVRTIGELAAMEEEALHRLFGKLGAFFKQLACGQDDRPVSSERPTRSISSETTFAEDTLDRGRMLRLLGRFARELEESLRREGLFARTVTVKVRYHDFRQVTRSSTSRTPLRPAHQLRARARELLARTSAGRVPVRLVGLGVSGLLDERSERQLPLFPEDAS